MRGVERFELTAVFEPEEDGWFHAYIAELPGVITAGPSLEETKRLLPDALREYLLSFQDEAPAPAADAPGVKRVPLAVNVDV